MSMRKIRDAADARSCLAEVERAGVSCGEWGRSHGVDGRSLQAWRLILCRGSRREPTRFVEIVTASDLKRFVVRCGPFSVDVDGGADEGALASVLRAMACAVATC